MRAFTGHYGATKEEPPGLAGQAQGKLPGEGYIHPKGFKESTGLSLVEMGDGQDKLNEGYARFHILDNICFLAEALTKEVDNTETCEVGEESYFEVGRTFRSLHDFKHRQPTFLTVENRARGKVKPQVDLSEHHEAQMPDTLRAPLGSCQQLSPCEVMAPLREREK